MAGPTLFRPSSIATGLVGYWKLDEASGSRADSSGNGNTLTDNNTVTNVAQDYWKTGENSGFFTIANSEYLSITDGSQTGLDITGSITMCAWIKITAVGLANTQNIIGKNTSTGNQRGYRLYVNLTTNLLEFLVSSDGTATSTVIGPAMVAGKWTHVACVYDGASQRIYVDGNLVASTAYSSGIFNNTASFAIGANAADQFFGGAIKDAAIWSAALTPIQIKSLALGVDLSNFAYRPSNVSTTPTAWWKLNELSGTRADSIGALTLTDNNTVTALGGYIEGVGAKTLIANSESLSVADNTAFDFSGGIWSVAKWFKTASLAAAQSIWANGTDNANWISLALSTAGTLTLNVQAANVDVVTVVSNAGVIKVDTNHHIVCKENGDTWQIYVDGIDVTSTGGTDTSRAANYTGQFYIGADVLNANYSTATYSDFAIWKGYSLSDAEIKSLACGIPLQQTGIVSYWKLDETSGTRADSIGSNTLTDNNTVLSGTGKVSNAADFERTNSEYLSIADNASLSLTTDFTLLCWFNPESSGTAHYLMDKGGTSVNSYDLRLNTTNVPQFAMNTTDLSGVTALTNGSWGHISAVYSGAQKLVYVNSAQTGSASYSTDTADLAQDFNLGKDSVSGTYSDGLMDEALVAKRWFRDEEIKTIYCKGLAGKELTNSEIALSSASFFLLF